MLIKNLPAVVRVLAARRRRASALAVVGCLLVAVWVLAPYDSFVRLMPRYYLRGQTAHRLSDQQVLFPAAPPPHPVDFLGGDVVLVMKSGYGTRDRIRGWLDAHVPHVNLDRLLLVADFASEYPAATAAAADAVNGDVRMLRVHDAVEVTVKGATPPLPPDTPRVKKYTVFSEALAAGDEKLASKFSKDFGYELDVMKFISSLDMAYSQWPDAKWYVMADDDSYLIRPSVQRLLEQFDPDRIHYLGNPEGHWTGRFPHGGSIFMLSRAAMAHLFASHRGRVGEAHRLACTTAKLGDWLLAVTYNKVGVYVEEGHKRFFSGEDPWASKIRTDRVCALLVGFHELKTGAAMRKVGADFGSLEGPATWWDVFEKYGDEEGVVRANELFTRDGWDFVGRPDEDTEALRGKGASVAACRDACRARKSCLAWTWEPEGEGGVCRLSPWLVVGREAVDKVTGINAGRIRTIRAGCPKPDDKLKKDS